MLQVLPALHTGGVERGAVDVAAALVEAGWTSLVVSAGGPMVRELDRVGALHITLPVDSKNPLTMAANIGRLAAVIRRYGVDIVHARSRAPAWSARAASRRTGAHLVTTFHGTYGARWSLKRRYNRVMTKGERVIAISEFIAEHMRATYKVDPGRVRVIPRGVDIEQFAPAAVRASRIIELSRAWRLPDGVPVIMLPARLTRWKGQLVLVEAVARLGRGDLCCVLVGDDQGRVGYHKEIEALIARRGLDSVVKLVGPCRDMPAAYMLADVVVSASTDPEAFGRVVVEAQAMGRPVVATDHGAARETVIEGRTGWLVPPKDADALGRALTAALALDARARADLAGHAIDNARTRFSKPVMCAATLAVYEELLAEGAGMRE